MQVINVTTVVEANHIQKRIEPKYGLMIRLVKVQDLDGITLKNLN